ncbi:DUF4142 domain-containing protein [Rhizobium sp. YIM 134829]|uniref:DUF4142 domain-containing protein n=1 Tax=Rhizobium sp. YIM 134829 TaxID=3390453 RepID=UPI00397DF78B
MTLSTLVKAASLTLAVALAAPPAFAEAVMAKPAGDAVPIMTIDRATFLKVLASANEFEIQSSKIALEKSQSTPLKQAAEMIIADHTKAADKLKATLTGKGVAVPPPTLSPKHSLMIDQLKAADAKAFDRLYLDMQAQAHLEAVALFRTYAGSGDDQELVGFTRETLPSLETHLAHVTKLIAGS